MKFNKIFTAFLTALLLACLLVTSIVAADEEKNYLKIPFSSAEEKLDSMELILDENGSQLYIDKFSGEIGFVDVKTGQILLSNPYDIATTSGSDNIKNQLLSQLIIKYEDNSAEKTLDSYSSAAQFDQIKVKKTKTGVRVEYIIGEMITRRLVPELIEKTSFEQNILAHMTDPAVQLDFSIYYSLKDPSEEELTDRQIMEMKHSWPITQQMPVYVFDPAASPKEYERFEGYIKEYAPLYTFEQLDADHELVEYESEDKSPPLFRMALEYSIDENGNLDVRLPANGIRFDETVYTLTNIQILPYFGAGRTVDNGEIFIPDGSGAIIHPADFNGKSITLTNKIYGQDYAYQKISGAHQEIMHLPVYGVVRNNIEIVPDQEAVNTTSVGFLAVINEGDSLATVTAENGGTLHKYFTAYTSFAPRPKDSYNLSEAISVGGGNAVHTLVLDRKYTGSYRIKYIMLNDDALAEEAGVSDAYTPSYVGMAKAYRDYLVDNGDLELLTEDKVKDDIPLYIESFGAIETIKRIASIPVTVLSPLTTFDDLVTMTEKLGEKDITNVNYKLTGFANGGLISTVPYKVKFDSAVGGNKGFKEFISYATENGVGVYPDFDFAYFKRAENFDGIANKDLAKTMDNRYARKQTYDSTMQAYEKSTELSISAKSYDYLYEEFNKNYSKLSPVGVSVATLGSDLNSDFNKKDIYNREDVKDLTTSVLDRIATDYENVLSDSGNAYSLKYVDNYLNIPLDSSNYLNTSESVPFMGMVLHGYKNFTGTAVNMAGDIDYEILKSIESGASLYFMLSSQNTNYLKESEEFNRYYSVGFDIWYDDLVEAYTKLNYAIGDCQTATIDDHEFILGERVPTEAEVLADKLEAEEAAQKKAESDEARYQKALKKLKLEARRKGQNPETVTLDKAEYLATFEVNANNAAMETEGYVRTKYTTDEGKIAVVTYSNGVKFILNFNSFDVTVEYEGKAYELDSLGFVKIK